jgi:hypothetical protein
MAVASSKDLYLGSTWLPREELLVVSEINVPIQAMANGETHFFTVTLGVAGVLGGIAITNLPPAVFGSYVMSAAQIIADGVVGFGLTAQDDIGAQTIAVAVVIIKAAAAL